MYILSPALQFKQFRSTSLICFKMCIQIKVIHLNYISQNPSLIAVQVPRKGLLNPEFKLFLLSKVTEIRKIYIIAVGKNTDLSPHSLSTS